MDAKHTPAPWDVRKRKVGRLDIVLPNSSDTASNTIAFDVLDHNASLIAAAPDLLAALLSILNIEGPAIRGGEVGAFKGIDIAWHFDKVRAAIAKATGGE